MKSPRATCVSIRSWKPVRRSFLAAGTSFNQMVTALERMMSSQHRLLSDISHELRTPLTRLQLGTALLRRRSGESKELERIEMEAHRLDSMINDLLVMSRNQAKTALVSETVKANQLWGEVLDNAAFEAEQMGKSFTVEYPPGPWPLYGNPNALESALENIVRNALRYSHTKISVSFSVDKDGITVNVDDDGPGVSPEDREQIFRPFYRTDEARPRVWRYRPGAGDCRGGDSTASRLGEGRRQPAGRPALNPLAAAGKRTPPPAWLRRAGFKRVARIRRNAPPSGNAHGSAIFPQSPRIIFDLPAQAPFLHGTAPAHRQPRRGEQTVVLLIIKRHLPGDGARFVNAHVAEPETSASGASLDTCPPATTRYSQPVLPLFCISCAISLTAK